MQVWLATIHPTRDDLRSLKVLVWMDVAGNHSEVQSDQHQEEVDAASHIGLYATASMDWCAGCGDL